MRNIGFDGAPDWRGISEERGGGHGGRRPGCRKGRGDRMERGALRWVLLDALRDGPKHGYEIIKSLEERTEGRYAPSPGAVYPTLQLLNDLGLVASDLGEDRRVYQLTETGKAELALQAEKINEFWSGFAAEVFPEASRHEIEFLQEELESLNRTIWGGLREAMAQGDRETMRSVRQAIERCRSEIRSIVSEGGGKKG